MSYCCITLITADKMCHIVALSWYMLTKYVTFLHYCDICWKICHIVALPWYSLTKCVTLLLYRDIFFIVPVFPTQYVISRDPAFIWSSISASFIGFRKSTGLPSTGGNSPTKKKNKKEFITIMKGTDGKWIHVQGRQFCQLYCLSSWKFLVSKEWRFSFWEQSLSFQNRNDFWVHSVQIKNHTLERVVYLVK